ncbi:hypothetical protein TNIN_153891 [Trichonephila inaurata madagascariensis]|uniref:Uncharacterized protein n=1 Tax=Trichonephila inaurata madagascariensis TaxID=2747483 RepID=A0A8X6XXX6_9ARAC|nr:hypothetical protein TNIN_153891 [Trichonephila inaurata madagascariensis]
MSQNNVFSPSDKAKRLSGMINPNKKDSHLSPCMLFQHPPRSDNSGSYTLIFVLLFEMNPPPQMLTLHATGWFPVERIISRLWGEPVNNSLLVGARD